MRHFPVFLKVEGRRVIVAGAGECAVAKLRLLLKTDARIVVYGAQPVDQIKGWAAEGKLTLVAREIGLGDALCAAMLYAAQEDATLDARAVAIGKAAGALTNIVDNLEDSAFITPAIVDRDPVTVAIGTEGAAPVLARRIKADLEERLPTSLGALARIGQAFRPIAAKLPNGRARRDFWSRFYFEHGPRAHRAGGAEAAHSALVDLAEDALADVPRTGHVSLVGTGPGDPELLTLKARRLLHEADVVLHDRLVPPAILELARREATLIDVGKTAYGPSMPQDQICALMVAHGSTSQVVRLKSGDPAIFGRLDEEMDALDAAGISFEIVPGITAASSAAAALKCALTKRGRNRELRLITAHDMNGFAAADWRGLSTPGAVAAIYMGLRAAKFLRGRLLMHGADDSTPVTAVFNASRLDQKIIATTLLQLPDALSQAEQSGPAVLMLGLSPRQAMAHIPKLEEAL